MTTTLNDSTSEFIIESNKKNVIIEIEEQAQEGTHLRNGNFQVRRGHMTFFILTMAISGLDVGYTIQLNSTTLQLILGDLFPQHNTDLAKLVL
jgi:hypothetical protein